MWRGFRDTPAEMTGRHNDARQRTPAAPSPLRAAVVHEMKERHTYPKVEGQIEISHGKQGVFIGGDPEGLRSLANLLTYLADVDQESIPHLPDGDRDHTHLTPGCHLSEDSEATEVCRLDAKGTGEFPKSFRPAQQTRRPVR